MSTLRASRAVAVVLLFALWPTLGLAQSAPPAGVVTGLQGTATVARKIVAQPIPLKFKDDLFIQDQVATNENSLVRVLLGGKALVTIRELSTFTISEEPERAAVALKSGKLAVGVAKSLLKPGEVIEIRTPNAIAAVRGSLLVVAVQTVRGVVQSFFTALDASLPITVTPLGGTGAVVALGANQAVGVSGSGSAISVGQVQTISPATAQREAQTATAPRTADSQSLSSPMATNISESQFQQGTALASIIAPAPAGTPPSPTAPSGQTTPSDPTLASATQTQLLQTSGSTLTVASQTAVQAIPPPPTTASLGVNAAATGQAAAQATAVPPPPPVPPVPPVPPGPIVDENLVLGANQTLKTYSGQSASSDPAPAVTVTNSTVSGPDNMIVVDPGANASLTGGLLATSGSTATPSSLTANQSIVNIQGVIASTTTGAFVAADPTFFSAPNFVRIAGGSLSLAGPLLADVQGVYVVSGDFLSVLQGGSLTASSVSPLLGFSGSAVAIGSAGSQTQGHLFNLGGAGSTASLGGSLASLTSHSVAVVNGAPGSALIAIAPGGTLTSPSALPLLSLSGSALGLGAGVRGILGTGGTATIGGPVITAAAGSNIVSDQTVPFVDLSGTSLNVSGALIQLLGGSSLLSGGIKLTSGSLTADALVSTDGAGNTVAVTGPVLDLSNATVTLRTLDDRPSANTDTVTVLLGLNQPVFHLASSQLTLTGGGGPAVTLGQPSGPVVVNAGTALIATGTAAAPSTINLSRTLFGLGAVTSTATQPLLQLDHTTVNQTATASDLIAMLLPPGQIATTTDPLLSATNSTINTSGGLLQLSGGSSTSSTASPFLFFDPSTVTSALQMIQLDSGGILNLAGPLVSAQNTTFTVGNQNVNAFGFMRIVDGAALMSTSPSPLLSFDASSYDGGNLLSIRRSPSALNPSTLTLSGPLLSAINGSSFNTSSLGLGPTLGTTPGACCSLVSITQGGQLTSSTTLPLMQLANSIVNDGPDAQSGGSVFSVSETFANAPVGELVAPSTVMLAGPLLTANGGSISALANLLLVARSSLSSTTTDPLIQLNGTTVSLGGVDPIAGTNAQSRLVVVAASAAFPASLSLQGPLFSAANSTITTGDEILGVFNGASLTSSATGPLLSITGGSATAGTAVAPGNGGNFISLAGNVGGPPSMHLSGPLLSASNTSLTNGNPLTNTNTFLFVAAGSSLVSTTASSLLSFDATSVDTAGNIVTLRQSISAVLPSTLTLAGPLFSATNGSSFNTTSLGSGPGGFAVAACCSGFFVGQGAHLSSTTTAPLIQLTNSTFNAGPDPQSGGSFFPVVDTFNGAPLGELVAPAAVTLSGPLLLAVGSGANGKTITALFNLVDVQRSSLTSSSPDPLVQLSNATVQLGGINPFGNVGTFGSLFFELASATAATVGSAASVALEGALLSATNSNLTMTRDLVSVFNGATLTSTTTAPLVQVNGGVLTTSTASGFNGFVLDVGGLGGPSGTGFATVTLSGPLFSASGSAPGPLNLAGGLANVFGGGTVVVNDLANGVALGPLTSITGGTDFVATSPGFAMFRLFGAATAADVQSGLALGTDRPLQGPVQPDGTRPVPGSLLQTSGATVTGQRLLNLDTALLEATAPLLNATAQSVLTTALDTVNLPNRANLLTSLGTDLIRLDASTLAVTSGALVNVNASKLTVGGNLTTLLNGATLTLLNGPLITVSNGGFVNIAGSLINFGGTGNNHVNITNSFCPCSQIGGINVALQNGALLANVQITNPIKNAALGTVTQNGALAVVNGAGSKLTVSGH